MFRVYLQVQTLLGSYLNPIERGLKIDQKKSCGNLQNILTPVIASKIISPDVSCSCKSTCSSYYGYEKFRLLGTAICKNCNGLSCSNSHTLTEVSEEYNDEK